MPQGKFIALEGIDGCGKTTQLELAHSYLWNLSKKIDILTTREPTRDNVEIRERMEKGTNVHQDAQWYAKMFIQDRAKHCRDYILPTINRGTHVLCDRYKLSTLSYQHAQGMPLERLIAMHNQHPEIIAPDLTIIFDCPERIAYERRKADGTTDVFENFDTPQEFIEFQGLVRQILLQLPDHLPGENIAIIDSTPSPEEIAKEVRKAIDAILAQ